MIYVLGGDGFVGSAICSRLADEGHQFKVLNRENYSTYVGDRCDIFVNCNGNSRRFWADEQPVEDFEASVLSTMKSIFDFKSRLYVFISSVDVYWDTSNTESTKENSEIEVEKLNIYGFHKWISEELVRRYSNKWLILRLGNMVGPGLKKNPVFDALTGNLIRTSKQSQYGLIHTKDMALAFDRLVTLGHTNQAINVCGTGTIRIEDISKYTGRAISYASDSEETCQIYNINNDMLKNLIEVPTSKDTLLNFIRETDLEFTG